MIKVPDRARHRLIPRLRRGSILVLTMGVEPERGLAADSGRMLAGSFWGVAHVR
jgi:hypothetical protein